MMEYTVKIVSVEEVTHNVKRLCLEKPAGYSFTPGHAVDLAINKPGWREQWRPFTFTSLNTDPHLELTIKCYRDHEGVTSLVDQLGVGDEVVIGEPWGSIEYKGPGCFIAGGTGITPFIAIIKQLYQDNLLEGCRLFFSNKTEVDIIYEKELVDMLGDKVLFIISERSGGRYTREVIDETFLKTRIDDFNQYFYVCGPDQMTQSITRILTSHGAKSESIVFEK